jgi:hypothetical protein
MNINIQNKFSPYFSKRNIISFIIILALAAVAMASMYLPGSWYKGQAELEGYHCYADTEQAFKGNTVTWTLVESTNPGSTISNGVIWYGDVGNNGQFLSGQSGFTNSVSGNPISVTYPKEYSNNEATAKFVYPGRSRTFEGQCTVKLNEPLNFNFVVPNLSGFTLPDDSTEDDTKDDSLSQNVRTISRDSLRNRVITVPTRSSTTTQEEDDDVIVVEDEEEEIDYVLLCEPNIDAIETGESVIWTASINPQPAKTPVYKWSGNDVSGDGKLKGSLSYAGIVYNSPGIKSASVQATIVDTNEILTVKCGDTVTVAKKQTEPVDNANLTCIAYPAKIEEGGKISWSATLTGLTGGNVAYEWSGDATGSTKTVTSTYKSAGPKIATVKATYGGGKQLKTSCAAVVEAAKNVELTDKKTANETTATEKSTDNTKAPVYKETPKPIVLTPSKCPGINYPTDIAAHWGFELIKEAYDKCWTRGYVDNTFKPNNSITRAEATKIVMVAAGIPPNSGCYDEDCGSPFSDLEMWQGPWIRPAYDKNIVKGYSPTIFAPNLIITRAEAAALIAKAFNIPPFEGCYTANCGAGHPDNIFTDIHYFWQGPYVRALWDKGIVRGTDKYTFAPNKPITRAELLKMAYSASKL